MLILLTLYLFVSCFSAFVGHDTSSHLLRIPSFDSVKNFYNLSLTIPSFLVLHVLNTSAHGSCKRANDWISEAKYPVITRDTADASSTPVVLGKIKRIKSMQPKPLEEEIAKSLGNWV